MRQRSLYSIPAKDCDSMKPARARKDFGFIVSTPTHNASKSDETRSFVRKHVMRPFKKKRHGGALKLEEEDLAQYLSKRQLAGSPLNAAVLLGAARPNPFATYPITLGTKDHELVHHIWSSRQVNFQPFRDYWFSLGMVDPAAMHLVLSNAAMHLNELHGYRGEDVTILAHNTAAIRSVNERMTDPSQNTSDEIVGAILGLICHEHLASNYERSATHMAGLREVLRLRDGQRSIELNKYVRLSLFWIEHNIAVDQDTIPLYPPPFHLLKSPYSALERTQGFLHGDKAMSFAGLTELLSDEMFDILTELSIMIETLKAQTTRRNIWDDPDFPGFAIHPILYRLLAIQATPLQDKFMNMVQEVCRLGTILFLAEVRRKFGVSPVVTGVQIKKLRELFESESVIWDETLECLRTWTLVVAGCAASTEAERTWVVQALTRSRPVSAYSCWDEVISPVSNMWWMEEVFSNGSKNLHQDYVKAYGNLVDTRKGP